MGLYTVIVLKNFRHTLIIILLYYSHKLYPLNYYNIVGSVLIHTLPSIFTHNFFYLSPIKTMKKYRYKYCCHLQPFVFHQSIFVDFIMTKKI